MKNIVLPFREAKGKTGNARTGESRAMIVETEFYPTAFSDLQSAIKESTAHFPNKEEAYSKCIKGLLQQQVKPGQKEAHIQEIHFGNYNLIFVNMDRFNTYPYIGIKTVTIDSNTKVHIS